MKNGIIHSFFGRFLSSDSSSAEISTGPGRDLHRHLASLTGIQNRMKGLVSSSGESFLDLGRGLQDIYSRSREMSELASRVVGIMAGDDIVRAMDGLSRILGELKGNLELSESGFEKISKGLGEYKDTLESIGGFFEKFRMLVLNLEMLGFFTQVENAHVLNSDNGFLALTTDVKTLSKRIFEKSTQIKAKSFDLKSLILHALDDFTRFKVSHKTNAMTMLKHSVANHEILSSKHEKATQYADSVSGTSRDIMEEIGEIVSSLQFHDITAQQLVHVKDVLGALQESVSSLKLSEAEKPGLLAEVCALQGAQLANTRKEAVSAVENIIRSLSAISARLNGMLNDVGKVSWASDMDGMSFMEEIDSGISTVIETLNANISEQTGLTQTMSSVSAMVSEMSVFVEEIESLGMNLQLIALNARIKAAHIGNEGAALDTISGSIYELSKNSREDTSELSKMLAGVVEIARDFDSNLENMHSGQEQAVENLVTDLKSLLSALHGLNDTVFSLLAQLGDMGSSLMGDISRTLSEITVHDQIQDVLGGMIDELEGITEETRGMIPASARNRSSSLMGELQKFYTMDSEHRVHAEYAGRKHEAPKPAPTGKASEYGDNVELF
jgi:methyl-accepting chemotaxis protein